MGPLLVLHVPLSEPFLTSSSCCDRPARPSSVSGAELCTIGPSAAECFVQHNTKPARMWRYRSSCPIVSEGEKLSTESVKKKKKKSETVESLCHPSVTKSAWGAGAYRPGAIRAGEAVA